MNKEYESPRIYAAKHKNEKVRMQSQSGGMFIAISDYVLKQNGSVYGCILNEENKVVHIRAEEPNDRNAMCGSKYVQSDLLDCFAQVRADLDSERMVLFTGTPCQIDGLRHYLQMDYENLYCVDLICHGVPSPLIWEMMVEWIQNRNGNGEIVKALFRDKEGFGWRTKTQTYYLKNGKKVSNTVFYELFAKHNALRPSCYICPYKSFIHPGDITIGDFWGIQRVEKTLDDNRGYSLALINNEKGTNLFGSIQYELDFFEVSKTESAQTPLLRPYNQPVVREEFWKDVESKEFGKIIDKYTKFGWKNEFRNKIRPYRSRLGRLKRRVMKKLT